MAEVEKKKRRLKTYFIIAVLRFKNNLSFN